MKLDKIKVEGLYGTFNHEVDFKNEEKITILIGQNGLGKTVILRMIKCFFDQDFTELKSLYFKVFTLLFENDYSVVISRIPKDEDFELEFQHFSSGQSIDQPFIHREVLSRRRFYRHQQTLFEKGFDSDLVYENEMDYLIEKFLPEPLRRMGPGIWFDPRRRREYTSYEIIERFKEYFPPEILEKLQYPSWIKSATESIKVRIIEAQRLLNRIKAEDGKYKSAVVEFSQEILDKIKTLRALASDLASRLDRTYPKRLLQEIRNQEEITSFQITRSLEELEAKRKVLNDVGLIDTEEEYIQPYISYIEENIIRNVLMLYIHDSNAKLKIYDDLERRLSLFLKIVNKRFLHKEFKVDKERGFKFSSTANNNDIPLTGLSSGEQHELVLFYQLIFNTSSNSLLLIDEPEISLHISWQKQFIDDLKEVIKLNNMDILIATHSPDIIGNYWHLAIQLEGSNFYQ
jgi:predicted ATP-binding protein involved in virulence